MKLNTIFKTALPIFVVLFASCSSEEGIIEDVVVNNVSSTSNTDVFSASTSFDETTRTVLSEGDVKKAYWSIDDEIAVFYNQSQTPTKFVTQDDNAAVATFSNSDFHFSDATTDFYALYPYQTDSNINGSGTLTASLPETQTAVANGFDPTAMLMTGHATKDNKTFAFKNVPALLRIAVKSSSNFTVNAVRFVANNTDKKIAGAFTATISSDASFSSDGIPSNISCTGTNSVRLNIGTASTGDATVYYIPVLPAELNGGFTVLLLDEKKKKALQRISSENIKLTSSQITDLGVFEASDDGATVKVTTKNTTGTLETPNCMVLNDVVDLGLPSGTLWCTKNVGASSETDNGGYYSWGELETKADANYDWGAEYNYFLVAPTSIKSTHYKFGIGAAANILISTFDYDFNVLNYGKGTLYKYNGQSEYARNSYPVDTFKELVYADDVAYQSDKTHVIPSQANVDELKSLMSSKSGNAFVITGNNSVTLTIPAGGKHNDEVGFTDGVLRNSGQASYWTRSLFTSDCYKAYTFDITGNSNGTIASGSDDRCAGRLIRPVVRKANFRKAATTN